MYNKELKKSLQFAGGCCDDPQTAQVAFPGGFASGAPIAGQAAIKAPTARILVELDCGQYQANVQGQNQQDQYRYVAMQFKELCELFMKCVPRKRADADVDPDYEGFAREVAAKARDWGKAGARRSYIEEYESCMSASSKVKLALQGVCRDILEKSAQINASDLAETLQHLANELPRSRP